MTVSHFNPFLIFVSVFRRSGKLQPKLQAKDYEGLAVTKTLASNTVLVISQKSFIAWALMNFTNFNKLDFLISVCDQFYKTFFFVTYGGL